MINRLFYTGKATIDLKYVAYITDEGFIQMKAYQVYQRINQEEVSRIIEAWHNYLNSKETK